MGSTLLRLHSGKEIKYESSQNSGSTGIAERAVDYD